LGSIDNIKADSFALYRGLNLNDMAVIATIPDTQNSYIDSVLHTTKYYYIVEAYTSDTCYWNYSDRKYPVSNYVTTYMLSSEEDDLLNKIKVYPNPVNDRLHIANIQANSVITIYDIYGRECHTEVSSDDVTIINTSKYSKGLYIITVANEDGSFAGVRKGVVE